ncbi:hypothetical protein C9374_005673 [Naegleria lovaniensis]|uniref:Rho-GAP domain-containing protein n=1 Tax=Naegleria lovaniensis TaxID=51637 RepID=A0AA88GMG3_NAELO|nr:uncharacterized protein C9374_005673 [Naegleria lovaniensis]KAG2381881.1 hypothetical protein C9374_005673 [Naegleria lovaniensis]
MSSSSSQLLPKVIVQVGPNQLIPLDMHSLFSSSSISPKQVTFIDLLDALQERLEIILPAKSSESAISKIFAQSDYQSILSQPSLETEQQVLLMLWSVKTKTSLRKNFLSGMVERSSAALRRKIEGTKESSSSLTGESSPHHASSMSDSLEQGIVASSTPEGKIKKKLLKMNETVYSHSGECVNFKLLSQVTPSLTHSLPEEVLNDESDFLYLELHPSMDLSRVTVLNNSLSSTCLNETLFNMEHYYTQFSASTISQATSCSNTTLESETQIPSQLIHVGDLLNEELLKPVKIPYLLRVCIKYVRDHGGLKTQGIFREAGSKRKLLELSKLFNSFMAFPQMFVNKSIDIPTHFGVMIAADMIKTYLRGLPDCLLTFDKYDTLIELFSIKDHDEQYLLEKTKLILLDLPEVNRAVLDELMSLCHDICCVEENVTLNKMSPRNMAIVIGPNLLFVPTVNNSDRVHMDSFKRLSIRSEIKRQQETISVVCDVCQFLIEHQEDLFRKSTILSNYPQNEKELNSVSCEDQASDQCNHKPSVQENGGLTHRGANNHSTNTATPTVNELLKALQEKDHTISQMKKETFLELQKQKMIKQLQSENTLLSRENKQVSKSLEETRKELQFLKAHIEQLTLNGVTAIHHDDNNIPTITTTAPTPTTARSIPEKEIERASTFETVTSIMFTLAIISLSVWIYSNSVFEH